MKYEILLIDDDEKILSLLKFILKTVGAQLRVSKTGEEALAFIESNPASLVLIDYSLPGMNGIELLHHIRALKDGGDIKVMMVTARDQTVLREEAEGLNVAAFISKPFSPSDLLHTVQAMVRPL